jgi:siroheme decarboxylase
MTEEERRLIQRVQAGLPLVEEPYAQVAAGLGMTEQQVIDLLAQMLAEGKIRRIGVVPNHYALGIRANGMVVWDIPDDRVQEIGRQIGARPEVSHCYRRPRFLPDWPYSLFCMVHSRTKPEVLAQVERIVADLGLQSIPHQVLFSTHLLKKSGVRLVEES